MNDLISRQDAIDAIEHICPVDTEYDCTLLDRVDVRYVLSDLPPANQWTPCSKELPKIDGHYIVYAPTYSGGSSSSKEHHDGVMFSAFKKGKWSIEHGYHKRPNCVVAWMPMPEPWKERR